MVNKKVLFVIIGILISFTACDNVILSPFSQAWKAPMPYDKSGATRELHVAAVSMYVDLSPDVNRGKIITFIDRIKAEKPNIRLILFPETILGYYYRSANPSEYQSTIAETIPGFTTDAISLKAIEHQVYISFGMVQKIGENLYNAQVLIGPDGGILSVYHKMQLGSWDEENGFIAGRDINLDIIDNIKVATIICSDGNYLETHKKIHKLGAELVLQAMANPKRILNEIIYQWKYTFTWHLYANRIGTEDGTTYDGMLFLSTPSGEVKTSSVDGEGYIYGVVKCR